MSEKRLLSLVLVALALPALTFAAVAPDDPVKGFADAPDCEPDRETPSRFRDLRVDRTRGSLAALVDLERIARQSCTPKVLLREWQDAKERFNPEDGEPAHDWRDTAVAEARALPVTPAESGWTAIGPFNVPGRIKSIVLDPRDENVLYAAAAGGGVFKSTDAGMNWVAKTDQLASLSSGALAIDPVNPDIVYYGTGESSRNTDAIPGAGIFKTTDGGETWAPAGNKIDSRTAAIAVFPSNPRKVVASVGGSRGSGAQGTYLSTDAGATWTKKLPGFGTDVLILPGTDTVVAAVSDSSNAAQNGIWWSVGGESGWKRPTTGFPTGTGRINIAAGAAGTGIVVAAVENPSGGTLLGVWKSTDSALTWTQLSSAPDFCSSSASPQCWYDMAVAVDPADPKRILLGGIDVFESTNGGTSFGRLTDAYGNSGKPGLHPDYHALVVSPTGVTWAGNDGGIYRSTDGGTTWEHRSDGLLTTQFYGIANSPAANAPVIGGLQDNGTVRYGGDADKWREVIGGDGGYVVVDQVAPNNMLGEVYWLWIHRSTNGGSSFTQALNGIPETERYQRALFIAPLAGDPARSRRFLGGTNRVFYTDDGAVSWNAWSDDLTTSTSESVSALAFSPIAEEVAWAGTSSGKVWLRKDGLWTNVAGATFPSGRYVKRIAPDPHDANGAWVSTTSASGQNVWKTADGGATWVNASGNLPNAPVAGLVLDPADTNRAWAGTDVGVFFTGNGGASWSRWGTGLPFARVDDIVLQPNLRRLRVGTHGRGAWEVSADLLVTAPVASFDSADTAVAGSPVSFSDTSGGAPTSWNWTFGDGGTSTEQNPLHVYAAAGTYTVTLLAGNAAGTSSASRTITVSSITPTFARKLVVPGQARAAGSNGAFFRSSLWLTNPSAAASKLRLTYVPSATSGGGGASGPKEMVLDARKAVAYRDVLSELFGATSDTNGVILVEVEGSGAVPLVTSRTFNDSASGTYGQFIPAAEIENGCTGTPSPRFLYGLGGDAENRSNVGIVNLGTTEISATLRVVDAASGQQLGNALPVTVPPQSVVQTNRLNDAAGAGSLARFTVKVEGPCALYAYASKLDNKTSDPIFLPAGLRASGRQWLDGLATAAGSGGTYFRSNLSMTNPGSSAATATIAFTARGEVSPRATKAVEVPAGSSLYYVDAVRELFDLDGVAGAFSISADAPLATWARTYNDLGASGTFGQFIPAFSATDLIGGSGAVLPGLSENATFRTNLGFVNTSASVQTVTAIVVSGNGVELARTTHTLEPGQAKFVSRALAAMGLSNVSDAYVRLEASTPSTTYAWASSIDNTSTDQIFVWPLAVK